MPGLNEPLAKPAPSSSALVLAPHKDFRSMWVPHWKLCCEGAPSLGIWGSPSTPRYPITWPNFRQEDLLLAVTGPAGPGDVLNPWEEGAKRLHQLLLLAGHHLGMRR